MEHDQTISDTTLTPRAITTPPTSSSSTSTSIPASSNEVAELTRLVHHLLGRISGDEILIDALGQELVAQRALIQELNLRWGRSDGAYREAMEMLHRRAGESSRQLAAHHQFLEDMLVWRDKMDPEFEDDEQIEASRLG